MKIKNVTIKNFKKVNGITGARQRRSLYSGLFDCPGKALDGKSYSQVSTTKASRLDEYGVPEWEDTVSTFFLQGESVPFLNLEELITFYNTKQSIRPLSYGGVKWQISSCGTVIIANKLRRTVRTFRSKTQRLKHEVSCKNRTFNVRRLVALAWLDEPARPNMRVLLSDTADESNIHYTNLYWSANSHTPEEALECAKYLNK